MGINDANLVGGNGSDNATSSPEVQSQRHEPATAFTWDPDSGPGISTGTLSSAAEIGFRQAAAERCTSLAIDSINHLGDLVADNSGRENV